MNPSATPQILLVVAKAGHEQGLLQHLQSDFGNVWTLTHPSSEQLRQALEESRPKALICELDSGGLSVRRIASLIGDLKLSTRIIAAAPVREATAVIRAMGQGARDLVDHSDPLHLQLVVARELGILQSWCERNAKRLAPYVGDEEGHATLDGVRITACDSILAQQLGAASEKAVAGTSLLQYVDGDHHHVIQQIIKSCLEGEGTIIPVPVRIHRADGTESLMRVSLKAAYQDDRVVLTLVMQPARKEEVVAAAAAKPSKPLDPTVNKRIEKALKQNQLSLLVQPISELVGEPQRKPSSKLDVYVMLKDAEGELPARKFIREARASGLIRYIDRWVIHNACMTLHRNFSAEGPVLLFLRLSRQTLHDPMLVATLKREIREQAIPADCLSFELFEEDIADLTPEERKVLQEIREAGFLLSVSHFGAGHESQRLLERIPVDFVKLDPKLTEKVQDSENTRLFIQQLVHAASARHAGVISTAVPNATVMATLWGLGVHYVQGNYLQEPVIVMQG